MTEQKSQRDEFKAEVSKIANRFLEIYFGEERPIELPVGWRILCALAGAITFLSFSFATERVVPLVFSLSNLNFTSIVQNILSIVMLTSPFVLALMIAYSIKKGGPLRFFLVGFFLYSLVLLVAV